MTNQEVLDLLRATGLDIKSVSSTVEDADIARAFAPTSIPAGRRRRRGSGATLAQRRKPRSRRSRLRPLRRLTPPRPKPQRFGPPRLLMPLRRRRLPRNQRRPSRRHPFPPPNPRARRRHRRPRRSRQQRATPAPETRFWRWPPARRRGSWRTAREPSRRAAPRGRPTGGSACGRSPARGTRALKDPGRPRASPRRVPGAPAASGGHAHCRRSPACP